MITALKKMLSYQTLVVCPHLQCDEILGETNFVDNIKITITFINAIF